MPEKILLYGDGELWPHWPVMVIVNLGMVCDYSECGMYVCGKTAEQRGVEPEKMTWIEAVKKLIELYGGDTPVEAHNNRIALQLREYSIHTLSDLLKFLEEKNSM